MTKMPVPTEQTPFDGSPESWHDDDAETLARVDAWIAEGHPNRCKDRLAGLNGRDGLRFQTTSIRLLGHCLREHGAGFRETVATVSKHFPSEPESTGLAEAIRNREGPLVDEVIASLSEIGDSRDAIWAASLINRSVTEAGFGRVWDALWNTNAWRRLPALANEVLANALGLGHRRAEAVQRVREATRETYDLLGSGLVARILWSPALAEDRDRLLSDLLDYRGADAAAHIVRESRALKTQSGVIEKAARFIVAREPDSELAQLAVGLCLSGASDFAIPLVVDWVISGRVNLSNELEWRITKANHERMVHDLAEAALKQADYVHDLAAYKIRRLRLEPAAAATWLEANVDREEACRLVAALVRVFLSEMADDHPATGRMVNVAKRLHAKRGVQREKDVLQQYHLDGRDANLRLQAVALARDVRDPPEPPNGTKAVEVLRQLPNTWKALGGTKPETILPQDPYAFLHVRMYDQDLEEAAQALDQQLADRNISERWHQFQKTWLERKRLFRASWESRFARILASGNRPDPKRLLTDRFHWTEMAVLYRLVGSFKVRVEPADLPETQGKKLDFLCSSGKEEFFVEVAAVGTKPKDVLDAAIVSMGGDVKKTLQNKLHSQFLDGNVDLRRPVVLAVQVDHDMEIEFDGMNSLYGPEQMKSTIDKRDGTIVAEGSGRDVPKAFFGEAGVECISAVALFTPDSAASEFLVGEMCRPLRTPTHPLSPSLWVGIRSALFGPTSERDASSMIAIPGITDAEALALAGAGIDDLSFFAAGHHSYDQALPFSEARFEELREEAKRRIQLAGSGRLEHLRSAVGVSLTPFHEAGIYTTTQLERAERPTTIPVEVWSAMLTEIAALR